MARRHRLLLRRSLVLTLSALAMLAAPAQADPTDPALATERYYSSYGEPTAGERAALATEHYLSSYGIPPTPAASSAPTANRGPSWTAAIVSAALLSITAAGLGLLVGRASPRPRGITAQAGSR
jgi:hypothetical protein